MASSDKPDPEYGKEAPPHTKPEASVPPPPPPTAARWFRFELDVALRILLFAATLTALIVLVTSKQTVKGPLPGLPVPELEAKFNDLPAFIYFLVALSVAGLYSIITTLASISVILKPEYSTKFLLHFVFWDVLILGVLASATGTAGGVAYIGLKGNDHVKWQKVCSILDKFCRHVAGSLVVSLFASVVLVLLVWLSVISLHRKIPK